MKQCLKEIQGGPSNTSVFVSQTHSQVWAWASLPQVLQTEVLRKVGLWQPDSLGSGVQNATI